MNQQTIIILFFLTCCFQNCERTRSIEFNQELADELKGMTVTDQIAASFRQGVYKSWTTEKWKNFKDSVFTIHKKRLEEIFNEYGFPGFDLVGKEGSNNFWLMTQHSDNDVDFQSKILEKIKIEVDKGNADSKNYAYLTDRVKINKGERQVYGTQVMYNQYEQAYPKPLVDSVNVNNRRSQVGLESLEQYLNMMTTLNFERNKEVMKKKGITGPKLYATSDSITFKFEK